MKLDIYGSAINSSSRGDRKYNIKTEISMNRSRDDEYEVTDINLFRKQNKKNDNYSTSTGKYIPKIMNPINQIRSLLNNKKEYSFERSLRNIRDNGKDIEKDKNNDLLRGENLRNHKIFVSSNLSKPKRIYKTSTQREVFRSHEYRLGDDEEYEPYDKKYKNYNKINKNININKNNYFNSMKNLEEEIEIEDEQDQIEYVPPKQLFKINQKSNGYNYNNNNKDRNAYNQPSKNINTNYNYHESSQIKNPKKKNFITIHKFKSEEENKNGNINNNIRQTNEQKINIIQNKNENKYQQYIPRNQKIQKNENKKQYEFQQSHTEVEFIISKKCYIWNTFRKFMCSR